MCYSGKRTESIYVAKLLQRFLTDEDGHVDTLLMKCLKPNIGSGTVLEDTPAHLPPDEPYFNLSDVIAGPLGVIPMRRSVNSMSQNMKSSQMLFDFWGKCTIKA